MNLLELLLSESPDPDEVLAALADLSDDDLSGLEADLVAAFEAADDPEIGDGRDLDGMRRAAAAVGVVREEIGHRAAAAADADAEAEALRAQLAAVDSDEDDSDEGDPDAKPPAADGDDAEETAAAEDAGEPAETVVASVPARTRPRVPRPAPQHARTPAPAEPDRLPLKAVSGLSTHSAGQHFADLTDLGKAQTEQIQSLINSKNQDGVVHYVAVMEIDYPEDTAGNVRVLTADNGAENQRRIQAVTSLAATGGLCPPVEVDYSLQNISSDRRPIRDSMVRFQADRGGIQFVDSPRIIDQSGAVDIITEAEDVSGTTKPCLTVDCGTGRTVEVHAVTVCIEQGNWNRLFWPEQFNTFWPLAQAQHAREAEDQLFTSMVAAACTVENVTTGQNAGAWRDVAENLVQAGSQFRRRHRMADNATVMWTAPSNILDLMLADMIRQHPGDRTWEVGRDEIAAYIRRLDVEPVFSPDIGADADDAQPEGHLNPWPTTWSTLLYHPGAFTFLDGGMLRFGTEIRDSTLNSTNDVRAHMETFEAAACTGVEAIELQMTLCPDGSSAQAIDLTGICTSAS